MNGSMDGQRANAPGLIQGDRTASNLMSNFNADNVEPNSPNEGEIDKELSKIPEFTPAVSRRAARLMAKHPHMKRSELILMAAREIEAEAKRFNSLVDSDAPKTTTAPTDSKGAPLVGKGYEHGLVPSKFHVPASMAIEYGIENGDSFHQIDDARAGYFRAALPSQVIEPGTVVQVDLEFPRGTGGSYFVEMPAPEEWKKAVARVESLGGSLKVVAVAVFIAQRYAPRQSEEGEAE